jgi:hypothetical protein
MDNAINREARSQTKLGSDEAARLTVRSRSGYEKNYFALFTASIRGG